MGNGLIVLQNDLIEASIDLKTSEELKIFVYAISCINIGDKDFKTVKINLKEFQLFTQSEKNYSRGQDLANRMIKQCFKLDFGKKKALYGIFGTVIYDEAHLELKFNEDIKPYLLDIKKNLTSMVLANIMPLSSSYAIRIYTLLKQYEKIGFRKFKIKELQSILMCPLSYTLRFSNFKNKVLDISVEQINETTDLKIYDIKFLKTSRKITDIKFLFKKQEIMTLRDLKITTFKKFLSDVRRIYKDKKEFCRPAVYCPAGYQGMKYNETLVIYMKNGLLQRKNTVKNFIDIDEANFIFQSIYNKLKDDIAFNEFAKIQAKKHYDSEMQTAKEFAIIDQKKGGTLDATR